MRKELIWLTTVLLAVLAIYLPGINNIPVFDDALLTEGQLFAEYGSLLQLQPRMLSYSTFVWVRDVFGEGWWKQRVFNLAIHVGVVLALVALYREVLRHIATRQEDGADLVSGDIHRSPALWLAIGFFALNPVAVYAVAYLIQRSILMATLFVVISLWLFAYGLRAKRPLLYGAAVLAYVLAVMSKEHALLAPLVALPLFVLIRRPGKRALAILAGAAGVLVALVGAALYIQYGEIVGKPFDQFSKIYLAQLAALGPNVEREAYALSIVNQAYFFFKYGMLWVIPNTAWMSIDLRPPFPLGLTDFPQILGVVGYLGVLVAGFVLLLRYRDWRSLVGFCVLVPVLLFPTEFTTVWVQDPFVLYRSYLWAIGLPGLVFILFHGAQARTLMVVGLVLAALLVWQSIDRIFSLATPERVWTDAIAKQPDEARAVGRWFPYLNRGNVYLDSERLREAYQDFDASADLGDQGMGMFNISAMHFMAGRYHKALESLDKAESQGYGFPGLHHQRGVVLHALRRLPDALNAFNQAMAGNPASPEREEILAVMGEVHLEMGDVDAAIVTLKSALQTDPQNLKARLSLGMAHVMKKEYPQAHAMLSELIKETPNGQVYYGRALANFGMHNKAEALADIELALRTDPRSPVLLQWRDRILVMY